MSLILYDLLYSDLWEHYVQEQAEMDSIRQEENANFKVAKAELSQGLNGVH